MKITQETVRVRASRTGTIYTAPGEEGREVRRLTLGEEFFAKPKREGRWAKVSTVNGRKIGYTKSKRLSVGDGTKGCVLSDFWGYVDPKKLKKPHAQSRRLRSYANGIETTPVVAQKAPEPVQATNETVKVVNALERLSDVVSKADSAPLAEPSRSRFAFFDRFCAMRERNHTTGRTGNDVNISEVRYKFATSLIRTVAVAGTLGYLAHLAVPFLG
jgi:hypothetical protein